MTIKLDVAEYCHGCREFKPVKKEVGGSEWNEGTDIYDKDVLVQCVNRKRCKNLVLYLKKEA